MQKLKLLLILAIFQFQIKTLSQGSFNSKNDNPIQLFKQPVRHQLQAQTAQRNKNLEQLHSQKISDYGSFYHIVHHFKGEYRTDPQLISAGRKLFDYIDCQVGTVQAEFYVSKQNKTQNLYEIYIKVYNPKYDDKKTVSFRIKQLNLSNENYKIQYNLQLFMHDQFITVSVQNQYNVQFSLSGNINSDSISFALKGTQALSNISVTANLTNSNQVLPNTLYLFYVCLANFLQVLSIWIFLRQLSQNGQFLTNKPAQVTVILCIISDLYFILKPFIYYFNDQDDGGHFGNYLFSIPYFITFIFQLRLLARIGSILELVIGMRSKLARKRPSVSKNRIWYRILTTILYYFGHFMLFILSFVLLFAGILIVIMINWGLQFKSQFILLSAFIFVPYILKNMSKKIAQFFPIYNFGYLGSRILIPLYITLCPQNILSLQPRITLGTVILLIELFQILLLYLQSKYGPRFFLPRCLQPNYFKYSKYRTVLQRDSLNQHMECLVCYQKIFKGANSSMIQDKLNSSKNEQELLEKIQVLKTPCQHYFHQQCLVDWMQAKLQCPNCQTDIAVLIQK